MAHIHKKKPIPRLTKQCNIPMFLACIVSPGFPTPPSTSKLSGFPDPSAAVSGELGPEITRIQSGAMGLFSKHTAKHPIPSNSVRSTPFK